MPMIKMLKRIEPSPHKLDFALDMILSILLNVSLHANNFQTTWYRYLVEQVYLVTNHDLHYQKCGLIVKDK